MSTRYETPWDRQMAERDEMIRVLTADRDYHRKQSFAWKCVAALVAVAFVLLAMHTPDVTHVQASEVQSCK